MRSLVESLSPFCSSFDAAPEPSVVHCQRLPPGYRCPRHAGGRHPTTGTDRGGASHRGGGRFAHFEALRLIEALEGMDRGGYLGLVGWIDARATANSGVAFVRAGGRHHSATLCRGRDRGGLRSRSRSGRGGSEIPRHAIRPQ